MQWFCRFEEQKRATSRVLSEAVHSAASNSLLRHNANVLSVYFVTLYFIAIFALRQTRNKIIEIV